MLNIILTLIIALINSGLITEAITLVEKIINLFETSQQTTIKAALTNAIAEHITSGVAKEKAAKPNF